MSELAKQLFESVSNVGEVVQAIAPGLKNLAPEAGAELSRLGTQGAMELASALFGNNAFVPYGPGQYTPSVEHDLGELEQQPEQDHAIEGHGQGIER